MGNSMFADLVSAIRWLWHARPQLLNLCPHCCLPDFSKTIWACRNWQYPQSCLVDLLVGLSWLVDQSGKPWMSGGSSKAYLRLESCHCSGRLDRVDSPEVFFGQSCCFWKENMADIDVPKDYLDDLESHCLQALSGLQSGQMCVALLASHS